MYRLFNTLLIGVKLKMKSENKGRLWLVGIVIAICMIYASCGNVYAGTKTVDVEVQLEGELKKSYSSVTVPVGVRFYNLDYYNNQVYLSYHIDDMEGNAVKNENERIKIDLDSEGYYRSNLKIDLTDIWSLMESNNLYIKLDIVDEKNVYWFSTNADMSFEACEINVEKSVVQSLLGEIQGNKVIFGINAVVFILFGVLIVMQYKTVIVDFINEKCNRRMIENVIALFIFCVVVSIVYCETFTSEILYAQADGIGYYLSKVFFINGMKTGEFPFWNPYLSIGTPFFSDVQKSVLSPFNILYFLFDETLAYNMTHVLQLIIAGYFMYLLMRQLTNKYIISIVTGFLFAFCTVLSGSRIEHPTIIATISFFPVIVYFLEKFRLSKSNIWLIISSVFMAIQFVSGFTQVVLYFDIALMGYMLFILYEKKYSLKEAFITCTAWVGTYVLLIAVQLLPTIILMKQSGRGEGSWETFSVLSYDLRILLMMLFPAVYESKVEAFGVYASSGIDIEIYIGVICLIYIIYEIIYCYREKKVKLFSCIMLGAFVFGMAPHVPFLGKLLYHLPLLGSFRVCARSLPIFVFCAIVLTGMGMAHISEKENINKIIKINIKTLAVIFCVFIFSYCVFSQNMFSVNGNSEYYQEMLNGMIISLVLCLVNLAGLEIVYRNKKKIAFNIIICILGVIMVMDVLRFSMSFKKRAGYVEEILDNGTSLQLQEYIDEDTENGFRSFIAINSAKDYYSPNLNIGKYNRAISSENNIYNSSMTFVNEKLRYWGIKETVYYPEFMRQLKSNTSLASMLGIHYILDAGEHDINTKLVNENGEKELLDECSFLELEGAGDGILIYTSLADWIEPDAAYFITVESDSELNSLFYADLYNIEYDNPEQDGVFEVDEKGKYQTFIFTDDIPADDVYFRIIVSSDSDIELNNLKIEKVQTTSLFEELPASDDGVKTYVNEKARQIIYIPDQVVKVAGYGESWQEDALENVDTISYVKNIDREMNLTDSNASIIQIDKKRNSVSAAVYSDTEIFVNHSQLAYPGWKAYVDGIETEIYTVNNLIQGAVVPQGEHIVEFRFEPVDVKIGLALTVVGIMVCFVWIVNDVRSSKK